MHLLALTTDNWIGLGTAAGICLSIILQRLSDWFAKRERKEVAAKVDDVRQELKVNTTVTKKVERQVNGTTTAHLKLIADLSRQIADATGFPEDAGRADLADKTYREHVEAQAVAAVGDALKEQP